MKLKIFFKKHYKKIIACFLSFSFCIIFLFGSFSAVDLNNKVYNIYPNLNTGNLNYIEYTTISAGQKRVEAKISNHNPDVVDAILGVNPPAVDPKDPMTSFSLFLRFNSLNIDFTKLLKFTLQAYITTNFSIYDKDGNPCDIYPSQVVLFFDDSNTLTSETCGFSMYNDVLGADIYMRELYAQFVSTPLTNGKLVTVRFDFKVSPYSYGSGWDTRPQLSMGFSGDESLDWRGGIWLSSGWDNAYKPPNSNTLNGALDLENNLMDNIGGNLDQFANLMDTNVFETSVIKKAVLSFKGIFDQFFNYTDNNFSRVFKLILRFSIALGLSGFVLNVVTHIFSSFRTSNSEYSVHGVKDKTKASKERISKPLRQPSSSHKKGGGK